MPQPAARKPSAGRWRKEADTQRDECTKWVYLHISVQHKRDNGRVVVILVDAVVVAVV